MRILCDQNVHRKYREAFERAEEITVSTVAELLAHDASDGEIAAFAEAHDWVVFTTDHDFYTTSSDHGLLVYDQLEDPTPGDIVAAVRRIDTAYESTTEILETIPDGWT